MSLRIALIIMMTGFFSLAAYAQDSTSTTKKDDAAAAADADLTSKEETPLYLICKARTAVRTLRVQNRPDGKCITTYTKNGVDQIVSRSSSMDQCSKVLSNIRENLEKAKWKCKDISEARVSSSEE